MREIKFRAWDKINKAWMVSYGLKTALEPSKDGALNRYDFVELMQYTGLMDNNNIPVFEGDIVKKWKYGWNDGGMGDKLKQFVVEYDEKEAKFINCFDLRNGVEIIGNIYENPELLET